MGLRLRTWFLLAAWKELDVFCPNSPRGLGLIPTIFGGTESQVQRDPLAASRGMKGGRVVGGGAFPIQKPHVLTPFHSKKGKIPTPKEQTLGLRGLVFIPAWNSTTPGLDKAQILFSGHLELSLHQHSHPKAHVELPAGGIPEPGRLLLPPWPCIPRDELPAFHRDRNPSDPKGNS